MSLLLLYSPASKRSCIWNQRAWNLYMMLWRCRAIYWNYLYQRTAMVICKHLLSAISCPLLFITPVGISSVWCCPATTVGHPRCLLPLPFCAVHGLENTLGHSEKMSKTLIHVKAVKGVVIVFFLHTWNPLRPLLMTDRQKYPNEMKIEEGIEFFAGRLEAHRQSRVQNNSFTTRLTQQPTPVTP